MPILLSPSKTQDFSTELTLPGGLQPTPPRLLEGARAVITALRALPNEERDRRLKLSPKLTESAHQALAAWSGHADTTAAATRPAAFAYTGETYRGLAVGELDAATLDQLQARVRILSALYGVLRPLDRIEAYRLDFGTRLAIGDSPSLYDFWRPRITEQLAADVRETDAPAVVNLASAEFARAVDARSLGVPFVTPEFRQREGEKLKNVTVFTKQARGSMARWVAKTGARTPEALRAFSEAGYRYASELSSESAPLFVRDRM